MCEVPKIPLVVILGATGAGKSKLALELAAKYGGEVISADAMQMYRGLDIVTNKVTKEEQEMVKHHMINILDPLSSNNVVDFRNRALPIVEQLMRDGKIPFICGGTNYYIESLLWKILVDQETVLLSSGLGGKRSLIENHVDNKRTFTDEEIKEGSIESMNFTDMDNNSVETLALYKLLQTVDPERAEQLHPKERRKIWRSLQVFQQHGKTHSEFVKEQGGPLGGGLRFPMENICLIEVWSEQEVLDQRCNKRVDKMIAQGLVKELTEFHTNVNALRDKEYTRGIWQSIGFKEFHPYLMMSEEERKTDEGKGAFEMGVELMKLATRQYSRKQAKWVKSRFLLTERDPPPVYRVNSTYPEQWEENVFSPAEEILTAFLEGRKPPVSPLEKKPKSVIPVADERRTYHCDLCDKDLKGLSQFRNHMNGKSHKKLAKMQGEPKKYKIMLTSVAKESEKDISKMLRNMFNIGLTDMMNKMKNLPAELTIIQGERRAKNMEKELIKKGIGIQILIVEDCDS